MQSPLAPQKAGSIDGSMQRPSQKILPGWQLIVHVPRTQLSPARQRV
jgi:hypothetical protein